MALGVSWMGWCRPAAPHGRQRRGYDGRTCERSRHVVVVRVTFEVQGDEKLGLRQPLCFRGVARGLGCAKGLRRPRCGCSGGPTFGSGGFWPLNQPTTWHRLAWPASVTWNMPSLGAQTPQIEFRFSTISTKQGPAQTRKKTKKKEKQN